jgi:hypothetical protein
MTSSLSPAQVLQTYRNMIEDTPKVRVPIELEDLNYDPDLRNNVVKFYKRKLLQEWLVYQDDLFMLLIKYFQVGKNGKVDLKKTAPTNISSSTSSTSLAIPSPLQGKNANTSSNSETDGPATLSDDYEKNAQKILYYLRKHLTHKILISKILEHYADKRGIKWWDLESEHQEKKVKKACFKWFMKWIQKAIDKNTTLEEVLQKYKK